MLVRTRQEGVPFPRRVILTVLDSLFDLFARAHRSGVLWNDVKLEHIYWDNASGGVSVIDWGNAQFLNQTDGQRRALPAGKTTASWWIPWAYSFNNLLPSSMMTWDGRNFKVQNWTGRGFPY